MTYRQATEKKIIELKKVYDDAENLRDVAVDDEKDNWNATMKVIGIALTNLKDLLWKMGSHGDVKLKGKY